MYGRSCFILELKQLLFTHIYIIYNINIYIYTVCIYIYYLHLPHPVTTWHFFSWRTKERYVRKALDRVGGSHISVPSFSCRVAVSWLCQCQVYGSGSIQGSFAKYSTKSSTLGLQLLHAWICMTNI